MPTYVVLYKFTTQGVQNIDKCDERIKENRKHWEALGGKLHGIYMTQGEYDVVAIAEAPSEEIGMAFVLDQARRGDVRSVTMRAYPEDEIGKIIGRVRAGVGRG